MLVKKEGHYNINFIVADKDGYIYRYPKKNVECLNYKPFSEPEILNFLREVGFRAPRLIEVRSDCIILSYIDGIELGKMYNWDDTVPLAIVDCIAKEILAVNSLKYDELEPLYKKEFPKNSFDFYDNYYSFNKAILAKHWDELDDTLKGHLPLFDDVLINRSKEMIAEELAFCHGDIHQGNIIIQNEKATLIDWESACIATISFEIAMHLRKIELSKKYKLDFIKQYLLFNPKFKKFYKNVELFMEIEDIMFVISDYLLIAAKIKRRDEFDIEESCKRFYNIMIGASKHWPNISLISIDEVIQIFGEKLKNENTCCGKY